MAMGFNAEYSIKEAAGADLNGAANTSLLSFYMPAGGILRRFGVVAEAAAGLLAPSVLKASYSTDGGQNFTDIGTLTVGSARARGVPVYRTLDIAG
ncbi:MAG TPA: hypothetical protein VFY39_04555, partial [Gammaproteobacteria bacterium]|nr:hypothetical protein [Gammaproteobacteria bacterium]